MAQEKKGLYILHIDGGRMASGPGERAEGAIGAVLKEPNGMLIEGATEKVSDALKTFADW